MYHNIIKTVSCEIKILPAKPSVKLNLTTSTPTEESHCKSVIHTTIMKKNVPKHSATMLRQNSAEQYHPRSLPSFRREGPVVFRPGVEVRKSYEVGAISSGIITGVWR